MSLSTNMTWELRSTNGDDNNGAGFSDLDPGTSVDYTNQNNHEQEWTDLAMVFGGTTLTSASGNFTAAMVGNCIYIRSGTNFVVSYYQIVTFTNANSVEIDRDATNGSNASSGTGRVGGARQSITRAFLDFIGVSHIIWVKNEATYTCSGGDISMQVGGTASLYNRLYGYNTTRGDFPRGNDRPQINTNDDRFAMGESSGARTGYWDVRHIRFDTESYPFGIQFYGTKNLCINCYFEYLSGVLGDGLTTEEPGTRVIDCEFVGTTHGIDANTNAHDTLVDSCYIYDCSIAIDCHIPGLVIFNTIVNWCYQLHIGRYGFVKGLTSTAPVGEYSLNCLGVTGQGGVDNGDTQTVLNSILSRVDGSDSAFGNYYDNDHYLDYNDFWDNPAGDFYFSSRDLSGPHKMEVDPDFVDIAGEDLRLNSSSPLINRGLTVKM